VPSRQLPPTFRHGRRDMGSRTRHPVHVRTEGQLGLAPPTSGTHRARSRRRTGARTNKPRTWPTPWPSSAPTLRARVVGQSTPRQAHRRRLGPAGDAVPRTPAASNPSASTSSPPRVWTLRGGQPNLPITHELRDALPALGTSRFSRLDPGLASGCDRTDSIRGSNRSTTTPSTTYSPLWTRDPPQAAPNRGLGA
jgi:hypothetical protein